jgi:hypothetical protein
MHVADVVRMCKPSNDHVYAQIHAWVVRQTEQEDWKPVQAERGCARCGAFVKPFTSA